MRMTKKITSIVLAALMVLSVCAIVPITASAVTQNDINVLLRQMDELAMEREQQDDYEAADALFASSRVLEHQFRESENYATDPNVERAYNIALAVYNHFNGTGSVNVTSVSATEVDKLEEALQDLMFDYYIMSDDYYNAEVLDCADEILLKAYHAADGNSEDPDLLSAYSLASTILAQYTGTTGSYTVTWKNGDNVIEEDTGVESGAAPTFNGTTPEKAEDETNTYTFSGWSDGNTTYGLSDTLPNVTADVTYTAQFTAIPKHTHVMTAHEAVAATCTTAGTSAYWECTGCGKFFSDEDGNSEIDDIDAWLAEGGAGYVAALGHNKTHYPAVAATFDAPGNIEYWYCDRCEKYFSDENCENEITQAQTVTPVRAHEILSDADFAYAAANGGTDWYLKADVNADGVTIASNLKIWNTDKTHTISGDITIADGCEFAVAGKKTTNLTGKVTLAGQDSKATSLRTPEIILTQPYKSGQVYGSPASTIITYNGRKIIYDATSLTAAAKNGGEYYVVDDIAISGATTVKADLTITGLKEDGSTPVITVSAPTSAKPFCLFNLSSGVDITIENVDFAATLSNTKTVGVVSADLNSSATSYNTVTITDSEISGFSVSDGYGAVYLHGYTQAVLTNVEMSGNGKYDVWVGSKGTVDIIGGDTGNVYLHSYSGTGAQLYAAGGANIDKITLDTTVTTTLKTDIGRATVGAIEANGDIPSEVVVIDPSVSSVNAPDGYEWAFSEEEGRKTLAPIDPENPLQGKAQIIGYQNKAVQADAEGNGVRILTKIDRDWLEANADSYGYVVAKVQGKDMTANFSAMKKDGGNGEKTIDCTGTYNNGIDGVDNTYVTLAVNGMSDTDQVAARFYVVVNGVTYYANYINTISYDGIIATYTA